MREEKQGLKSRLRKSKVTTMLLLMTTIACLTGCGVKSTLDISSSGKVKGAIYYYLTEDEVTKTSEEQAKQNNDDPEAANMMAELVKADGKETINNKVYYRYKTDLGEESLYGVSNNEETSGYMKVTTKSFEYTVPEDTTGTFEVTDTGVSDTDDIEFSLLEVKMPGVITKTNGKLSSDKKTVTWDLTKYKPGNKLYAYTEQSKTSSIKLSGVKNNGYITKAKTIKVVTNETIKSIKLNGKKLSNNKSIKISKQGKYKLVIKTDIGSKTFNFTYDKKAPTVNIKAKTYKNNVKIKATDKVSGIKSIKLNNKTIKNNYTVKENGKYTLKVVDKAGNKKTIKFKISK